jgi:peptide deformylase
MGLLKVACLGNPVLRKKAEPLTEAEIRSPDTQRLIADMIETLREYEGVGLAAPQVHVSKQIVIAEVPAGADDEPAVPLMVLINPEIVEASEEMEEDWEGCLSIPDLRGCVPRHARIRVVARDRLARRQQFQSEGFVARVIQHEIDHLHGVVFLDRMTDFQTLTFLKEYARYWAE